MKIIKPSVEFYGAVPTDYVGEGCTPGYEKSYEHDALG